MLELGADSRRLHRELGADLAASGVDMLVAVGPQARYLLVGWNRQRQAGQAALHFASAGEAWLPLWRLLRPGDAVLLKGSRKMQLETIPLRISQHIQPGQEAA
jgi:UDP-N-acetylmuramoyl-tripeptide--D-alanyl-D-alanine ligase